MLAKQYGQVIRAISSPSQLVDRRIVQVQIIVRCEAPQPVRPWTGRRQDQLGGYSGTEDQILRVTDDLTVIGAQRREAACGDQAEGVHPRQGSTHPEAP